MQKWEYLILDVPDQAELNRLGSEGWELIAIAGTQTQYWTVRAFFKRPIN